MNIAFLLTVSSINKIQRVFFLNCISISFLRLHSAFSVQFPSSTRNFNIMFPSVQIRPLNTLLAFSVNLHGITNIDIFHNNLRITLSSLKSYILRKYSNPFNRCGMYPNISKCNAKRCKCCKLLYCCFTSTVNIGTVS